MKRSCSRFSRGCARTDTYTRGPTRAGTARAALTSRRRTKSTRTGAVRSTTSSSTREQEDNYFFKLSAFQERLEALYAEREDFVAPRTRYNEALSFIRSGLRDVPLTRHKLTWGVQVPWDREHVFYVWFDALLNYYSALSYAPAPAGMAVPTEGSPS